ncbi:MAG: helix-turn-helix transcriptional regulator [Clostridia bacterium]|nr:helix-turn-helix transcriptional regulator [Clostridia bacterium]
MTVLERILQLRLERNWSEYRLSEESGIAQTTISSWFKKDIYPSIPSLEKICKAYDISMAQFFNFDNEPVSLSPEQNELLENWNRLSGEQKTAVLNLLKTI